MHSVACSDEGGGFIDLYYDFCWFFPPKKFWLENKSNNRRSGIVKHGWSWQIGTLELLKGTILINSKILKYN